ncbi:MAG: hypothetical protein H0T51_21965 [Pirellulales bacterium]|nr:hypothetical protein [Pirellulales bacterium]
MTDIRILNWDGETLLEPYGSELRLVKVDHDDFMLLGEGDYGVIRLGEFYHYVERVIQFSTGRIVVFLCQVLPKDSSQTKYVVVPRDNDDLAPIIFALAKACYVPKSIAEKCLADLDTRMYRNQE